MSTSPETELLLEEVRKKYPPRMVRSMVTVDPYNFNPMFHVSVDDYVVSVDLTKTPDSEVLPSVLKVLDHKFSEQPTK